MMSQSTIVPPGRSTRAFGEQRFLARHQVRRFQHPHPIERRIGHAVVHPIAQQEGDAIRATFSFGTGPRVLDPVAGLVVMPVTRQPYRFARKQAGLPMPQPTSRTATSGPIRPFSAISSVRLLVATSAARFPT